MRAWPIISTRTRSVERERRAHTKVGRGHKGIPPARVSTRLRAYAARGGGVRVVFDCPMVGGAPTALVVANGDGDDERGRWQAQ